MLGDQEEGADERDDDEREQRPDAARRPAERADGPRHGRDDHGDLLAGCDRLLRTGAHLGNLPEMVDSGWWMVDGAEGTLLLHHPPSTTHHPPVFNAPCATIHTRGPLLPGCSAADTPTAPETRTRVSPHSE